MATKKHHEHPHLTGEHRWGDTGQLILFFLFLAVWIADSFFLKYSTFLAESISIYFRIPVALFIGITGVWFLRSGMKQIFGTERTQPGVIKGGAFRIVRHPIYFGAILFFLTSIVLTLSIISVILWGVIILFYIAISKYEEKILTDAFGEAYTEYKNKTGMLFPKII